MEYPFAAISDIHSNLESLRTVLDDIEQRGIERVICLGDIVGYGPNPLECLDLVIERCQWSMMGNHDFAVLYEPTNFNAGAEAAAFWTRQQFEAEPDADLRRRRWHFLGEMEVRRSFGNGFMCIHGSPRRPINEYVFADDVVTAPTKMQQVFDRITRCCLVGHTHVQGVFVDEPDFYNTSEINYSHVFDGDEKVVINVGSVGQPRDRDPRSSYTIIHEDRAEFVRLEYDINAVANKISAIGELNDFFGQRLYEGR